MARDGGGAVPRCDAIRATEKKIVIVVPANAGTHNPGRQLLPKASASVPERWAAVHGSPRSRGRRCSVSYASSSSSASAAGSTGAVSIGMV